MQRKIWGWSLLILVVCALPIVLHLEDRPIRMYDEARLAISAIEMYFNHDYVVVHYGGKPEMWSTKPPLMIWLQTASIHFLGIRELAFRLPSVIAALLLLIGIITFSKSTLQRIEVGFLACFVLITSEGFLFDHAARRAEYDMVLTLFTTMALLMLFRFTENRHQGRTLLYALIFLSLACLTKGVMALIFLPGVLIYLFFSGMLPDVLRNRFFLIGVVTFLVSVFGYYGLREMYNPGYLQAVWDTELGGRFAHTRANHQEPFFFYLDNIVSERFSPWYILFLLSLFYRNNRYPVLARLARFNAITGLSFLLIISIAQTKLPWYDIPIFPLMALNAGLVLTAIYQRIRFPLPEMLRFTLFVLIVFGLSYRYIMAEKVLSNTETQWAAHRFFVPKFIKKAIKNDENLNGWTIVSNEYEPQLLFYQYYLKDRGQSVQLKDIRTLQPGDQIMMSGTDRNKEVLNSRYYFTTVARNHYGQNVLFAVINELR